MNTFQTQIVKMVRDLPDDALLDLVRAEMGNGLAAKSAANGASRVRVAASDDNSPAKPKRARRPRKRAVYTPALAEKVLHAVKIARRGVSTGEVEEYTKLQRTMVQRALGELVGDKKLAQFGKRRFSRYATTKALAKKASLKAAGK